jgi:hypothetical protein
MKIILAAYLTSCLCCLAQETWASDMIFAVTKIEKYAAEIIDYIQIISRRSSRGLSSLCKILPHTLPISSAHTVFVLSDCMLTGLKNRPCFNIVWGKHGENNFSVHHSHLESCQSLWSLVHQNDIFVQYVQSFQNKIKCKGVLAETVKEFCDSTDFEILSKYIRFMLQDCFKILNEDNRKEFSSSI